MVWALKALRLPDGSGPSPDAIHVGVTGQRDGRDDTMKILCATDGSRAALTAARWVAQLALDSASEVRILRVLEHGEADAEAWEALDEATTALETSAANVTRSTRHGRAVREVLDAAKEIAGDAKAAGDDVLVAVGDRGHTPIEHLFLGSVAERVVRHAPSAVLVARPVKDRLDRVIVGVDGTTGSANAIDFLCRLPLPADVRITLVGVVVPLDLARSSHFLLPGMDAQIREAALREREWMTGQLAEAAAKLRAAGRTVDEPLLREGDPPAELLEAAAEVEADLVVTGARGAGRFDRLLLGSVSEKLVRHAPVGVLVVRPNS